jgi:acetoin utilization deacetylase AcuC-like enzyme
MNNEIKNAFVLIRPPGHHAGFYGPVENPVVTSSGFCIVNNVAIGAAYLKNTYRNQIKKIAIVDFDVHHGNGTEEIIQMLNYKKFSKSFSFEKNGFFTVEDIKQINWLDFDDAKNILFISTHIYDKANEKKFYPYSGGTETNTNKNSPLYPGGILNIPFGFKNNLPYEYRNVFRSKVIPRLCKFKPDFIFISAGFDGHENELINQHHMSLNEFDFGFITQQIQFVANKFSNGRVVSVLEGGYNVSKGLISSFAQSALTHARFLNTSVNMFQCYNIKLSGIKRKYELEDEMDIYNKNNKVKNKPRRSERIKHHDEEKDEFGF